MPQRYRSRMSLRPNVVKRSRREYELTKTRLEFHRRRNFSIARLVRRIDRRPATLPLALDPNVPTFRSASVDIHATLPLPPSAMANDISVSPFRCEEIRTKVFEFLPTPWREKL